MSLIEKKTSFILVVGTSNFQSLNQKSDKQRAILQKNKYKEISQFFIDFLP